MVGDVAPTPCRLRRSPPASAAVAHLPAHHVSACSARTACRCPRPSIAQQHLHVPTGHALHLLPSHPPSSPTIPPCSWVDKDPDRVEELERFAGGWVWGDERDPQGQPAGAPHYQGVHTRRRPAPSDAFPPSHSPAHPPTHPPTSTPPQTTLPPRATCSGSPSRSSSSVSAAGHAQRAGDGGARLAVQGPDGWLLCLHFTSI